MDITKPTRQLRLYLKRVAAEKARKQAAAATVGFEGSVDGGEPDSNYGGSKAVDAGEL